MSEIKSSKLLSWSDEQLHTKLNGLRDELYHLRYKMRVEEVENPNAKRVLKRNIARVLTAIRQREIAKAAAAPAAASPAPAAQGDNP